MSYLFIGLADRARKKTDMLLVIWSSFGPFLYKSWYANEFSRSISCSDKRCCLSPSTALLGSLIHHRQQKYKFSSRQALSFYNNNDNNNNNYYMCMVSKTLLIVSGKLSLLMIHYEGLFTGGNLANIFLSVFSFLAFIGIEMTYSFTF